MTDSFTSEELRGLAARASTIDERLAGGFVAEESEASATKAARHRETWCEIATAGDEDLFCRRLRADGIDLDAVLPLLGDVQFADGTATPAWVTTFRWAFDAMTSGEPGPSSSAFVDPDQPLPFEELFVPLVETARQRRDRRLDGDPALLSESAQAALQRSLLHRLCHLCGPALCEGFAAFAVTEQPSTILIGTPLTGEPNSRTRYERYLAALCQADLRRFFIDRPVLARLLAKLTDFWMAATAELIERLRTDLPAIAETFHGGNAISPVSDIGCGLSDPHNGGRTVFRLTFGDGPTIGYKPKDLGLDGAWRDFLEWLDEQAAPPSARAPEVLERPGYGWVEWISQEPCANAEEAESFFRRAGAMLCLLRLLQGTDFHLENVIAAGDRPAPVDLETLMHPRIVSLAGRAERHGAVRVAKERLHGSVLATDYLPQWVAVPGGRMAGIGGLNQRDGQAVRRWGPRNTNSDAMSYGPVDAFGALTSHLPTFSGEPLSSVEHRGAIAQGYELMYRFLLRERSALLADDGPLTAFRSKTARAVLRPTRLYALLIQLSLKVRHLGDGVGWSLHFDFLKRLANFDVETDGMRAQQRAERLSLQDLDIPFASLRSDRRDLVIGGGTVIDDYVERSSFDRLIDRVHGLSEADLDQELQFIAQSLEPGVAGPLQVEAWPTSNLLESDDLTAEAATAQARVLAAKLDGQAVRENGAAAWIGALPLPTEERAQLDVIGQDLYAGASGAALFLAALHRVTGEGSYRDLAMAAFEPFRSELRDKEKRARAARLMGIGGGTGIASVIYALVKSAVLMEEPALLQDAAETADLISDERLEADRYLDVLSGSAGAILCLLALHQVRPDDVLLDRALACGRRLLLCQRRCEAGGRAWQTLGKAPLTGFSHGAAGIALALLRLYRETGETAFLDAARDGIAYETALFSSAERGWPDLREISETQRGRKHVCQWCHGSAGIGLARIAGLDMLDDESIRADIEVALEATCDAPIAAADHLCCGNFGRLEVLFSAARRLGYDDLVSLVRRRAAYLVARAESSGGFGWLAGTDRYNPGFFTGVSGVGYALLRFTRPEILPSVLLWE